jgi:hypothetical protein
MQRDMTPTAPSAIGAATGSIWTTSGPQPRLDSIEKDPPPCESLPERIRVVMSNKGLDRAKERLVKVRVEIPTYGTPEQAQKTAENAIRIHAVSFQTTLTGKYKGQSFTYNANGNKVPQEPASDDPVRRQTIHD